MNVANGLLSSVLTLLIGVLAFFVWLAFLSALNPSAEVDAPGGLLAVRLAVATFALSLTGHTVMRFLARQGAGASARTRWRWAGAFRILNGLFLVAFAAVAWPQGGWPVLIPVLLLALAGLAIVVFPWLAGTPRTSQESANADA